MTRTTLLYDFESDDGRRDQGNPFAPAPWSVCGAAVGYGAASGVYGKDLPTKAYPQGTLRR